MFAHLSGTGHWGSEKSMQRQRAPVVDEIHSDWIKTLDVVEPLQYHVENTAKWVTDGDGISSPLSLLCVFVMCEALLCHDSVLWLSFAKSPGTSASFSGLIWLWLQACNMVLCSWVWSGCDRSAPPWCYSLHIQQCRDPWADKNMLDGLYILPGFGNSFGDVKQSRRWFHVIDSWCQEICQEM